MSSSNPSSLTPQWGQGSAPDGGKQARNPSGKRLVLMILGYACAFGLALSLTIRYVLHNMKDDHQGEQQKTGQAAEQGAKSATPGAPEKTSP